MAEYTYQIENGAHTLPEFQPLYYAHYCEMEDRLKREGLSPAPYRPDWQRYIDYWMMGYLTHYNVRHNGEPVAYANVYVQPSMHNRELVAHEDAIWVKPEHRNGIGRKLTKFVLKDLQERGVKRAVMTARTDPRAEKLWKRLGFKETARELTMELN